MTRRRLNLPALLSLLPCVAVGVLWASGDRAVRAYAVRHGTSLACIGYDSGGVVAGYRGAASAAGPPAMTVHWDWAAAAPDGGPLAPLGFATGTVAVARQVPVLSGVAILGRLFETPMAARYVKVPWWSLAGVTGAAPAIGLLSALRRRRRSRPGLCPACGYDLRATPGGCPECGRETPLPPDGLNSRRPSHHET